MLTSTVIVVVRLSLLAFILLMGMLAKMFRKAGPNEALIVYGFRGPRVIKGHGTVIFPMVENCRELSLELMSFDVAPQQDLYTKQGVAVTVEAVAQIKVRSDQESILTAAEQFLSKTPPQREGLIRLVMEGHLRGIIGQLTVEQIVKEPEMVGDRMRATCADDVSKRSARSGVVHDQGGAATDEYITNMGRPTLSASGRCSMWPRPKRSATRRSAARKMLCANRRLQGGCGPGRACWRRPCRWRSRRRRSATSTFTELEFTEQSRRQEAQADKAYEIHACDSQAYGFGAKSWHQPFGLTVPWTNLHPFGCWKLKQLAQCWPPFGVL